MKMARHWFWIKLAVVVMMCLPCSAWALPSTTVMIGQYSGGDHQMRSFLGAQTEWGVYTEALRWKSLYLQLGCFTWGHSRLLGDIGYRVRALKAPLRFGLRHVFRTGCGVFLGGNIGYFRVIERFNYVEKYDVFYQGLHLGFITPVRAWPIKASLEWHYSVVDIHELTNLNLGGSVFRLGLTFN